MNVDYISEDEFWEVWQVVKKFNGELFEHKDVKDLPLNHVWTILESGTDANNNWYACPGFHIVNKLGYVMTKNAWDNNSRDAVYFDDARRR